jgi:hypothetical protein
MGKWAELNDFSMYDGKTPCILCKEDSQLTIVGDHWKCSVCAHIFNKDGSPIGIDCYCDICREEHKKADKVEEILVAAESKEEKVTKKKGRKKK